MIDEETLAQINGRYVMPPDAGPAWRAACEYGLDMSLVECALRQTPNERLNELQRMLDMLFELNPNLNFDVDSRHS